jgi:hypothetical protein
MAVKFTEAPSATMAHSSKKWAESVMPGVKVGDSLNPERSAEPMTIARTRPSIGRAPDMAS